MDHVTAPNQQRTRLPLLSLVTANIVSNIGNDLTFIAIPWFVLQTTGSPAKTGVIAFATILPTVIAGFLGGALVDRLGFKRMSVTADVASGVTVAAIPLLFHTVGIAFEALVALAFLGAILDAPGRLARLSLLPELAQTADTPLERANSIVQGARSGSLIFAPILAGILISLIGASNVLFIDAVTFAFSALVMMTLVPSVSSTKPLEQMRDDSTGYLADVREGISFLINDRLLIGMTLAAGAAILVTRSFTGLIIPVYANQVFGDVVDLGMMFSVQGGAVLVGITVFGFLGPRLSRRITFIGAFAIGGLPLWLLAGTPGLIVTLACLAVYGVALGPLNPLTVTILQGRVPETLRGRVFGAYDAITTSIAPVGLLASGFLLEQIGLSSTLIVLGVLFLSPAVLAFVHPSFREMDSLESDRAQEGETRKAESAG